MSHFVRIKTNIRNLTAFNLAAKSLGLEKVDRTIVNGYMGNKTNADAVWQVTKDYDVGLVKNGDGTYDMVADWWGTDFKVPGLANKLKQTYAVQSALRTAKLLNRPTVQRELTDGRKRLEIIY